MSDSGVCVVTHPLSSAGENATRTLLNILAELGPVSLVTADLPEDSTIREDREVIELTTKGAGDGIVVAAVRFVLNQLRMCDAIRRRPEEVVLFFGATSYLLPILFARSVGKIVLVEPRGDVPLTLQLNWEQRMPNIVAKALSGAVRALERAGFAAADRVVTYTPNMARELGLEPDSANVYPYGARYVDTDEFSVQVPFEERSNVVGFVGRIDEEKGIRELAEVAKQLPEGVTFRFVGDGPLYSWLETELANEIATGDAELAGWVDHSDVPAEFNKMKLLVMPSHPTEGLPTTILEAMACGTPVYATPVAGVPDVVKSQKTGMLMKSRDPQLITRDISELLCQNNLATMSNQSRGLIEDRYSLEEAVKRYRGLLSSVRG
ncbi:glycosyltransferase family 4 protein [Halorubrum ruber]|uniref:Glycosyltransferase family 4 protein n=1 Tax=Halorubrum ruber TaxID=2982524 RepID=A0A8T8LJ32_9EURY|nr:glycosyltransferase family 4 protein [Halorubrum ruber]QUO46915.1 glycosyltransferase family 4 protein [Halorubrum ruber]